MARAPRPLLSAAVLLRQGCEADVGTRPLRVVVADADPSRRQRLVMAVEAAGEAGLAAATWADALGVLSRTAVDAVLLSLDLPVAGGLAAGRVLRGWPHPVSALPLLAMHRGTTRVQEKDWRDAGFDALLTWPGDVEGLAATLRSVVVRLTPAAPLDAEIRAALLADHGAEGLAARDAAALQDAGAALARLRAAADAAEALEPAEAIAAACESIGALAAAAAARAAGQDFPRGLEALMTALAAAGSAIRFAGRARR